MNETRRASGWLRHLDRGPSWGSYDISPSRYGVTRYRLAVFPPGISPDDRRILRVWRSWPLWGTALWLVAELGLTQITSPESAMAVSAALAGGPGAVVMVLSGHVRTRVRTLSVVRMAGYPDPPSLATYAELAKLVETLADADVRRSDGELSAVEHEAIVWQVYDRLAPAVARSRAG